MFDLEYLRLTASSFKLLSHIKLTLNRSEQTSALHDSKIILFHIKENNARIMPQKKLCPASERSTLTLLFPKAIEKVIISKAANSLTMP